MLVPCEVSRVLKYLYRYPLEAYTYTEKQSDGRIDKVTIVAALETPDFPLAALTAATAVSHSDALTIGVRPALVHVAPSVVRTTYRVSYACVRERARSSRPSVEGM